MVGYGMFVLTGFLILWISDKMIRANIRAAEAEASASVAARLNEQAQAVKESEEKYRAICETAVDAIITINEMGIIESINPAGEKLFGYQAEELMGRNVKCLMPSPDRERHDQYLENYRRTGIKKIIGIGREVFAMRKDGSTFPMRLAVSEVWLGKRRIFTGQVHDISERRKMEEGLKKANASKDQFLAALSHELRTPLTPALMVIAARESDPSLSQELRDDMATARRNLELEVGLIDDLLDLNRVIRGKIQLHLQPRSLHPLLQRALAVCHADIEVKSLSIQQELRAQEQIVDADAGRLLQVFWNILRNAAKFTPKGGAIIIRSYNPNPRIVRVEITDTGIGIAPEKIARLFIPFEQGDVSITQQFGGMGLGLAISKALLDLHNGRIEARSEGEGKGTTFIVELPITQSQIPLEEAVAPDEAERATRPVARKLKLLLVEDHLDTLRILGRLLQKQGIEVTPVQSMAKALSAIRSVQETAGRFDLIVSDLGLPDGDGLELMRILRDQYGLRGIALSGYGMEEDIEKSREAGFQEHLTKPVKIAELLQAIKRVTGEPV